MVVQGRIHHSMNNTCMHLLALASYTQVNCTSLRTVTDLFWSTKDKSKLYQVYLCGIPALIHFPFMHDKQESAARFVAEGVAIAMPVLYY